MCDLTGLNKNVKFVNVFSFKSSDTKIILFIQVKPKFLIIE